MEFDIQTLTGALWSTPCWFLIYSISEIIYTKRVINILRPRPGCETFHDVTNIWSSHSVAMRFIGVVVGDCERVI